MGGFILCLKIWSYTAEDLHEGGLPERPYLHNRRRGWDGKYNMQSIGNPDLSELRG